MKELTGPQIGELVKILREKCPNSLKDTDKDNLQIVVDNINKPLYDSLVKYVHKEF
jgi:hypothetical protein